MERLEVIVDGRSFVPALEPGVMYSSNWVHDVTVNGVKYVPKSEPEPRTGHELRVDGNIILLVPFTRCIRFREDPEHNWMPDIVDADGKCIGYVSIHDGEVSVE